MCGLAGLARFGGVALDDGSTAVLRRMTTMLSHRGPDDMVIQPLGPAGLGFTRLSLMDPEFGGQPFTSADGQVTLIANGEVYNHKDLASRLPAGVTLRTRSDCEVLLHLYQKDGLRFLDQVQGMYAIIIVDRRRNRLVLARDRFGIKPLYFHQDRHRIVLASEIKALFADPGTPRRLDWAAALSQPMLSAAPQLLDGEPTTWFDGIGLIPAATITEVDLADGSRRDHRYWTFPGPGREVPHDDAALIAEYRELLAQSVVDCASADAEVGLLLSGGIDSTAVAALAAGTVELHTFSVMSGSTVLNGDAEHAYRAAEQLGVTHHQVLFGPTHTPSVAAWKRLLWLSETPLCGAEIYYRHELHRYAKQVRPELKAMLLGAASDEMNGGYTTNYANGGDWDDFSANIAQMHRRRALGSRGAALLWNEHLPVAVLADSAIDALSAGTLSDPYEAYLAFEYHKIQQYNVWHEDRTAAGSGIEARVPFLDHRLVELVTAIPPARRRALLWDKRILREAMRGIVPDYIVDRPKVPFFYGEGERYTHEMLIRTLTQDDNALTEEALATNGGRTFLDGDAVRSLLGSMAGGASRDSVDLLLRLVNLGQLEVMLNEQPPPLVTNPVRESVEVLPMAEWDVVAATEATIERTDVDLAGRPALTEGTLLLRSAAGTTYLAVQGSIEFVLDDDEPYWRAFLEKADGERDFATILAEIGCSHQDLAALILEASEAGVLETRPASAG
ncbi:asparagine synthase (glutamine-hydrolyzing) [Paractinoplanes ferrugineus]|uniref:asparagine synthase (glutamine-hydrolyzing) n=1 Tax=Paractinoplanes ferrugineus TaxID=113564 RepID=A0A919JE23_9ACTN|nr:asparagine synthase (glutamine-hydrolyzing) [Actinoplanes ferrugineus]GIE15456.1 asparagine synthetase [glutamine-hydrolyzing] 2 [Actinoplanes ferrugineus]